MVSPLDIHIMELHQLFHNNISPRPPIENIPDNMEIVNRQILNQTAQGYDETVRHLGVDNRSDNLTVVHLFIVVIIVHMQKLIDGIGKFRRHLLAHLGTAVFRRHLFAYLYKPVEGYPLPVLRIVLLLLKLCNLPVRIVDQISQLYLILLGNNMSEGFFNLLTYNAGGTAEQMNKSLIFPVQIAEKVLGTLWQSADCHQIYNLTGCRLQCRILA